MYIAINRFKIVLGKEEQFENIWRSRDTHLNEVPGFKKFNFAKGSVNAGYALYISHSLWDSKKFYSDWTKSESFKLAHKNAAKYRDLYLGAPGFEGFEVIL